MSDYKNLAEHMKAVANKAYAENIGKRFEELLDEAMRVIANAAERGETMTTWTESGWYMANYRDRVTSDAVSKVFDHLRAEGFTVSTERRGARGLGAIILW